MLIRESASFRLGVAWIMMCVALTIHVTDEALTGFLSVYNPTVIALHAKLGFWPMPLLGFREWLTGQLAVIGILALLSRFAFRNAPWIRPIFLWVVIVAGLLNAIGHIAGTILGHTVETVRFARPAPGFYSSPLLVIVSGYSLLQLRRTQANEPARRRASRAGHSRSF